MKPQAVAAAGFGITLCLALLVATEVFRAWAIRDGRKRARALGIPVVM